MHRELCRGWQTPRCLEGGLQRIDRALCLMATWRMWCGGAGCLPFTQNVSPWYLSLCGAVRQIHRPTTVSRTVPEILELLHSGTETDHGCLTIPIIIKHRSSS